MGALTDNDVHSPTAWRRDLAKAGWKEKLLTVYKDPEGNLWRGPYGAWCELQRRKTRSLETVTVKAEARL